QSCMDRLAAAVIEHARLRARHEGGELRGDVAIVHVLVALAHIDRMGAVPEFAPGRHAVFLSVIPGRREAASPESINTKCARGKGCATSTGRWLWIPALASLGRNDGYRHSFTSGPSAPKSGSVPGI